jgi:chromosome segregation ATPase
MASEPSLSQLSADDGLSCEQGKVEQLTEEIQTLKANCAEDLATLKAKLSAEMQISSTLQRSLALRSASESLEGKQTEQIGQDDQLKVQIRQLESKALDLEADNYALEERMKSLTLENQTLQDSLVRPSQSRDVLDNDKVIRQVEGLCSQLDTSHSENTHLKAQLKSKRRELKTANDENSSLARRLTALTSEQEILREELEELKAEREQIIEGQDEAVRAERDKLDGKLESLGDVNMRLMQDLEDAYSKLRYEEKRSLEAREALAVRDEDLQELMEELQTVHSLLRNKDQNIERLESEITKEAEDDHMTSEALRQVKKENTQLKTQVKAGRAELKETERSLDMVREQLSTACQEARMAQKELGKKQEEVKGLLEELDVSRETVKEHKHMINVLKESFTKQIADRVKAVQMEKLELEDRLNDVDHDTLDTRSLLEPSLKDELAQLEDYKPAKASLLFTSSDIKRVEKLSAELLEKDHVIEVLSKSSEELQANLDTANKQLFKVSKLLAALQQEKEEEVQHYRVLIQDLQSRRHNMEPTELQAKVIELQAEIDRLVNQMMVSHQHWAEENYVLTVSIRDAEFQAAEARMKIFELTKELTALKQRRPQVAQHQGAISRISKIFHWS